MIAVLWITATMALLLLTLNSSVRTDADVARSELWLTKGKALFAAAIEIAAARLIDKSPNGRWPADGQVQKITFGDAQLSIGITDVNGLVDVNQAPVELISGLLQQLTNSQDEIALIIQKIKNWRGSGEQTTTPDAQEDPEGKGTHESDKNTQESEKGTRRYVSLTQLYDLLPPSATLVDRLLPYITIYNNSGRINPLTASKTVLLSVPEIAPLEVDALIAARERGAMDSEDAKSIIARYSNFIEINPGSTYSITVQITGAGLLLEGQAGATIVLVADAQEPYHVIAWNSYPQALQP